MGNKPAERKRKKKGRPSLLDLQKRNLRLQKLQQEQEQSQPKKNPNPSPNPNPHLRLLDAPSGRRATRRNPNPDVSAGDDDGDDDDGSSNGKRREKKLKLVLRIPNSANSASESDDGDRRKGERNNSSKGTDALQGKPSDLGPTTPLPDKKLLEFILDRLQKKDTYGVFAEPVDPEELPDYHEIIEHPMDFATVRKKLSSGSYANLEQIEEDVFLISSNAMQYNSPDTIYYRQARAIQELAKKNFENLRQESDDNEPEPEPKTVRRGRPPNKNIKRSIRRPSIDRAASDFSSSATLANAGEGAYWSNLTHDLSRKGSASDTPGFGAVSAKSYNLRPAEPYSWAAMHRLESNEEYSGSGPKGNSSKYGKRFSVIDENRRNTYKQPQHSTFVHEPSILTTFYGERKQLMTVDVHFEHAYARSLARFAANLGPVGWAIAAKKIERVLPPGTKFGPGWIGESEAPRSQQPQPPLLSTSTPHASSSDRNISTCPTVPQGDELSQKVESSSSDLGAEGGHLRRTHPPISRFSTSVASSRSETADVCAGAEPHRDLNHEGGSNLLIGGAGASSIQSKAPFQHHSNLGLQPTANGYTAFGFNVPSQVAKMVRPARPSVPFCSDAQMTHSRALDMVSKSSIGSNNGFCQQPPMYHLDAERAKLVSNSVVNSSHSLPVLAHNQNPEGAWRNLSQPMKQETVPPDLNVRFQSPGSPASGAMVDTQQPDLALQL